MKKYTSREQIIKDIDKALAKVTKAKAVAQEHLDQESFLIGTTNLSELRAHREAADFQLRKIKRLENVRLKMLKEKLSEFDTAPLALPPDTLPAKTSSPALPPPMPPCASSDDVTP